MTWFKNLFTEKKKEQRIITPRSARASIKIETGVHAAESAKQDLDADESQTNEGVKLRKWVKTTLSTAPWAALAIILFSLFASGAVATSALMYGLTKMAIAVLITVIADETMFNGLPEPTQHGWLPSLRRSAVFIGVCWMLAVT